MHKKTKRRNSKIVEKIAIISTVLMMVVWVMALAIMFLTIEHKPPEETYEHTTHHVKPALKAEPVEPISEENIIVIEAENIIKEALSVKKTVTEIDSMIDSATTVSELNNALESLSKLETVVSMYTYSSKTMAKEIENIQPSQNKTGFVTLSIVETETEGIIKKAIAETQEAHKAILSSFTKINLIKTISRVIYAESCGEPLLGKIAVGASIVNRMNSIHFPNNVEDVVKGQYAAYKWVTDKHLAEIPECVEAAQRAVNGEDPLAAELGEATIYFLNPKTAEQDEVEFRQSKHHVVIGNHLFSGLSLYW